MTYQCSICGHELYLYQSSKWHTVPTWIGEVMTAECRHCLQQMTLLRDEQGRVLGTQAGFNTPFFLGVRSDLSDRFPFDTIPVKSLFEVVQYDDE